MKQPHTSDSRRTTGRPHLYNGTPRRHIHNLVTSSISLPAGGSNLMTHDVERTPPRFLNEENNPHDLDPFQEEVLRHFGDSNFQMRPH